MRNLIPPADYTDPATFARETAALRRAWHCVGLTRDLPNDQDWILVRVVDRDVVVQRFGDELRAFTNTCPHRFNAIRSGSCGNGPLTCGFHRWSFDRDGRPTSIPFRSTFAQLDLDALCLERWALETCGELVFVRLDDGVPLEDWLGAAHARLAAIAAAIDRPYAEFTLEVAANWKIVVQNTLEFDHVYSVHPDTFGAIVENRPAMEELPTAAPHVAYLSQLAPPANPRAIQRRVAAMFARATIGSDDRHEHHSLFPLTTIGVFRRESISLLRYVPRGPQATTVHTRLFLPIIPDLRDDERVMQDAFAELMAAFSRQLGDEDRAICESWQRGVANATAHQGAFGAGERLVWEFQRGYRAFMT